MAEEIYFKVPLQVPINGIPVTDADLEDLPPGDLLDEIFRIESEAYLKRRAEEIDAQLIADLKAAGY
jgi:hypothetical protein